MIFDSFSSIEVRDNYLRFNRIAPADEGRYVCTASNHYGNTTKVAEVIVNSMSNTHWLPEKNLKVFAFIFQSITHRMLMTLLTTLHERKKHMKAIQFLYLVQMTILEAVFQG
jgi:Immunoglobulin I-set domain